MEELAARLERIERQVRIWRAIGTVLFAVLLLGAAAQNVPNTDSRQRLVVGELLVVGEKDVHNTLERIATGRDPLPKHTEGLLIGEEGIIHRGSKGFLIIADGPDGVPAIRIFEDGDEPKLRFRAP